MGKARYLISLSTAEEGVSESGSLDTVVVSGLVLTAKDRGRPVRAEMTAYGARLLAAELLHAADQADRAGGKSA